MNGKKPSVVAIFFATAFVVGLLVVVAFNIFWVREVKHSYSIYSSIIKKDYIHNREQQVRSDVLRTVQYIQYVKISYKYKVNDIVQSSLENLIKIANNIYKENRKTYDSKRLKSILVTLFAKSRFYFNNGFYLFVDKKGRVINKSAKIRFSKRTTDRFLYFFSNFKSGFFDGETTDKKEFASYVEFFKPLGVYVVSCILFNSLEDEIKRDVIFSVIKKNSIVDKNRYIFINTKSGNAIITNNRLFNNGTKLWDTYKDKKDKERIISVFKKELQVYRKPAGGFIYYKWYEPATGKITDKISFIYGYKPWGWIIGEGFYLDRATVVIDSIKSRFYSVVNRILTKSYIFFFFVVVMTLISVYFAYILIRKNIEYMLERFEHYFKKRVKLKKDKCKVSEFCYIIDYINRTIDIFNRYENEFLEAFSYAMEARDTYTRGHSHRVGFYAKIIAEALGLDPNKQEELYKAGLLHDIGKIGVPDNILLKPGKLTPNEYRIVQYHSIFSYEIVYRVSQFKTMASYIKHHHERCDGSGYPDGLKCDKIELEAKILAIADVFDALTSRRTYRDKLSPERAIEILKKEKLDQDIIKRVEEALVDNYVLETDTEVRLQLTKEVDSIRKELFDIDYMTGLKRRRVFVSKVENLIKQKKKFAMFMVDVKSLSFINYEFSTRAGDKIIVYTAIALSEILEEMGYKDNELSRAYNDAFLFIVPLKDEDEISILPKLGDKIKSSLIDRVKSMFKENDGSRFVNHRNEKLEYFIDFHVIYCLYPYESNNAEEMIYMCSSRKTLSLIKLNNIDNLAKK